MIKAVIFDLFETLITERNTNKISSTVIADKLGIPVDIYGKLVSSLRDNRYRGEYPDFRDVLIYIMKTLDRPYKAEVINRITAEREESKAKCFKDIPSTIISLLSNLKNRGLKLIIISNASYEEILAFNNSEIYQYFDEAIFSCHTGYIKPEPEIYYEACKRIGVEAKECLYLGDGGSNELVGARKVGMNALCTTWYTSQLGYDPPEGFPIVKSTCEVMAIIDSYIEKEIVL